MNNLIEGTCFCVGNGITAYQIISQARWTACGTVEPELGKWVFEHLAPGAENVAGGFKSMTRSVVVAGYNFGGGGKSNDHPVLALKGAGVKLIVAESFSRIFFRNCINLGLPVVQCPGVTAAFQNGDTLYCDLRSGIVENRTRENRLRATPLNSLALEILEADNLLAYYGVRMTHPEQLFLSR